jgi:hypothetical protein
LYHIRHPGDTFKERCAKLLLWWGVIFM